LHSLLDMSIVLGSEIIGLCQRGQVKELSKYLKHHSQLVSCYDNEGNTLLTLATRENQLEIVKLLLSPPFSVDVNQRTSDRCYTPLILASSEGNRDIVEYLLTITSLKIDETNSNEWTSLMCACYFKYVEIVRLLLQHGANVHLVSKTGCSGLYLACNSLTKSTTKATSFSASTMSAETGNPEKQRTSLIIELLLTHGASINLPSSSGITPMHILCEKEEKELVVLLIEKSYEEPDLTLMDHKGRTVLDIYHNEKDLQFLTETIEKRREQRNRKTRKPLPAIPKNVSLANSSSKTSETWSEASSPSSSNVVVTSFRLLQEVDSSKPNNFSSTILETNQLLQELSSLNTVTLRHLSQSSYSTITYLTESSSKLLLYQREYLYIASKPFLFEFYLYFTRTFTSLVLSLQVLLSNNILDNRTTTMESVMAFLDSSASASGLTGLPIVTGILKTLIKLPNEKERKQTIENLTHFFPSVSSHTIIDLLVHELTLLEEDNILLIMKMNKKMKKLEIIKKLYEKNELLQWLYDEIKEGISSSSCNKNSRSNKQLAASEIRERNEETKDNVISSLSAAAASSSPSMSWYSYTLVQAYCDLHIGKIMDRLLYCHRPHPEQKKERNKVVFNEIPLLKQPLKQEHIWQLHCIALDMTLNEENKEIMESRLRMIHEKFSRQLREEESMKSFDSLPVSTSVDLRPSTISAVSPSGAHSDSSSSSDNKVLHRTSSEYHRIMISLEEKMNDLQVQLTNQSTSEEKEMALSSKIEQQNQEILEMKQQLSKIYQWQQRQQERLLLSDDIDVEVDVGGSSSCSSPGNNQLLVSKQRRQTTKRNASPFKGSTIAGGGGEAFNERENQHSLYQHIHMTETIYELIQQVQLIQEEMILNSKQHQQTSASLGNSQSLVELSSGVETQGCCLIQ
jgi:ankyrin repeat protein